MYIICKRFNTIGFMDPINIPQYMDPMGHGKIPMF